MQAHPVVRGVEGRVGERALGIEEAAQARKIGLDLDGQAQGLELLVNGGDSAIDRIEIGRGEQHGWILPRSSTNCRFVLL